MAFAAKDLVPVLVTTFVLEYVTQVVLSLAPFELCKRRILPAVCTVGRHTSIRVVSPAPAGDGHRTAREYVFHQPSAVPWGEGLPIQCPKCFALRTLSVNDAGLRGT